MFDYRSKFNSIPYRSRTTIFLSPLPCYPLLVTSYIDVVPPHIPFSIDSFSPSSFISRHGRGSVAAQIKALEHLLSKGVAAAGDALLIFVIDEEDRGGGMKHFLDLITKTTLTGFLHFHLKTSLRYVCAFQKQYLFLSYGQA